MVNDSYFHIIPLLTKCFSWQKYNVKPDFQEVALLIMPLFKYEKPNQYLKLHVDVLLSLTGSLCPSNLQIYFP